MISTPLTDQFTNTLYYDDCLTLMRDMPPASADLIYLDPPFNSARDYNAIYKDETGRPLPDQIEAFRDTWRINQECERSFRDIPVLMRENGIDDDGVEFWRFSMRGLRKKNPALFAYLTYMTERLVPMKGILKPTGSIYLHCDPKASHYIKIVMDVIFGHKNFMNEIVWCYKSGGASKRWFARKHDTILVYAKQLGKHTFNQIKEKSYGETVGGQGGKFEYYEDNKGTYSIVNARDWWQISMLSTTHSERLGYATQKPLALLTRIITASSNEGDVVFDPFCGCATTIEAAHKLNRRWIGCDITIHAIKRVASVRLQDRLGLKEGVDYQIQGVPRNLEGARDLWGCDEYHFQKWAVGQVGGFVTSRKTGDGGIDGRLYFTMSDTDKDLSSMVLEVKGGKNVGISTVRNLRGVLERDEAEMAGLIILEPLGDRKERNFRAEMASAGDLELNGIKYPRMQILTVQETPEGKEFHTPSRVKGRGEAEPRLPMNEYKKT